MRAVMVGSMIDVAFRAFLLNHRRDSWWDEYELAIVMQLGRLRMPAWLAVGSSVTQEVHGHSPYARLRSMYWQDIQIG